MKKTASRSRDTDRLRRENDELRVRLEQAEATLRALASGDVDAVVVADREVFTLETPTLPYRLAVEQMAYPAVTLTGDGNIIYANRRFADQLGSLQSELVGQPLATFVSPQSRDEFAELMRAVERAEGDGAQAEITLKGSGEPVAVCLGITTLAGGALGSCLVVCDLTIQRQYDELRRLTEALQIADRQKDEFVATLAHELRNPLAPIRNAVQALKAPDPDAKHLQWGRDVIDRQVTIMARLLEDLLDVSRISLNKLELRKTRVELKVVLDAALETSRPVIEAGHHRFTVTAPPESVLVEVDPVRLAQVLSNLLNNSAKYTEDGGDIRLAVTVQNPDLIVSVKDTGIGIAPEMLPRLFEIFSQAKSALVRSQGGLGIGLALVKGLVDLHGGSIEVHSDGAGHGSEFVLRLPCVVSGPA